MFGKQTTAFLSYLRLSIYMSIVAVAIVLSFHLRRTASEAELRMAKPLGAVFWALSVSCLGVGLANYTSMSICARLCWNGFFFSPVCSTWRRQLLTKQKERSTNTAGGRRLCRAGGGPRL